MPDAEARYESYGSRLRRVAETKGDAIALVFSAQDGGEREVTWSELHRESNRVAHWLNSLGSDPGSLVVVNLPNSPEHLIATFGAWKAGACVLPLRHDLPEWERARVLGVVDPLVVIGHDEMRAAVVHEDSEPVDKIAEPAMATASGGSTGVPKVILRSHPAVWADGPSFGRLGDLMGWAPGQTHLVAGPLYHQNPFVMAVHALLADQTLVLMERFDAERALDLIETKGVSCGTLVPTMLIRMLHSPGIEDRDLLSVVSFLTGSAPTPAWVKERWISLLGGERLWEVYGASEGHGLVAIRGDEWQSHRGSVGRPIDTVLRIVAESGASAAVGEVGEIYMRPAAATGATFEYVGGHDVRSTDDGLVSVGDLGRLDDDGYLFIADRRTDLIITGGANVYPAEVEAALGEHDGVADVVVVGVPDLDWGRRVHAIVEPRPGVANLTAAALEAHAKQRLARYKVPKTYEFMDVLPRNEMGKIRRTQLATERATKRATSANDSA